MFLREDVRMHPGLGEVEDCPEYQDLGVHL